MISRANFIQQAEWIKPCDRCGGQGHLLALPAYVMAENIRECTLVYIQCERCDQRISSDDVLGADPDLSDDYKTMEVVSVWNKQDCLFKLRAVPVSPKQKKLRAVSRPQS
ncbi:MAG: hypothetical protein LJE74_08790 [Proteobacteria bacterium]|nr:hypothetical protein [Pseudomonadota bacterium]